tara:strand:- start:1659 stop:1967 length:309 start_codon:yes stop_codon:yes gene_type:complete
MTDRLLAQLQVMSGHNILLQSKYDEMYAKFRRKNHQKLENDTKWIRQLYELRQDNERLRERLELQTQIIQVWTEKIETEVENHLTTDTCREALGMGGKGGVE